MLLSYRPSCRQLGVTEALALQIAVRRRSGRQGAIEELILGPKQDASAFARCLPKPVRRFLWTVLMFPLQGHVSFQLFIRALVLLGLQSPAAKALILTSLHWCVPPFRSKKTPLIAQQPQLRPAVGVGDLSLLTVPKFCPRHSFTCGVAPVSALAAKLAAVAESAPLAESRYLARLQLRGGRPRPMCGSFVEGA